MTAAAPFDLLALNYDVQFTSSALGRVLRRAVWRWLDRAFPDNRRVCELGCGTGEDALHLAERGIRVLALDQSRAMLSTAAEKVERHGFGNAITLRQLDIECLANLVGEFRGNFDGAFSNFGALNCVANLTSVARALASLVIPRGRVVLCMMGPVVPWEWGWFLRRGQPAAAFRRLTPGGVGWRDITVRYPSIGYVRRTFAQHFTLVRSAGLGVLLPPSYADAWAREHPEWIERLERWERRIESWPLVPRLADHYLLELVRR